MSREPSVWHSREPCQRDELTASRVLGAGQWGREQTGGTRVPDVLHAFSPQLPGRQDSTQLPDLRQLLPAWWYLLHQRQDAAARVPVSRAGVRGGAGGTVGGLLAPPGRGSM